MNNNNTNINNIIEAIHHVLQSNNVNNHINVNSHTNVNNNEYKNPEYERKMNARYKSKQEYKVGEKVRFFDPKLLKEDKRFYLSEGTIKTIFHSNGSLKYEIRDNNDEPHIDVPWARVLSYELKNNDNVSTYNMPNLDSDNDSDISNKSTESEESDIDNEYVEIKSKDIQTKVGKWRDWELKGVLKWDKEPRYRKKNDFDKFISISRRLEKLTKTKNGERSLVYFPQPPWRTSDAVKQKMEKEKKKKSLKPIMKASSTLNNKIPWESFEEKFVRQKWLKMQNMDKTDTIKAIQISHELKIETENKRSDDNPESPWRTTKAVQTYIVNNNKKWRKKWIKQSRKRKSSHSNENPNAKRRRHS
eukprot:181572_1